MRIWHRCTIASRLQSVLLMAELSCQLLTARNISCQVHVVCNDRFNLAKQCKLPLLGSDRGKLAPFSGLCVRARGWSRTDSERCHCLSIDSGSHFGHVVKLLAVVIC
jgi:hypothetical protein